MVRTVISLEDDDKRWLDRMAAEEGVSMTEIVRRAVRLLRARTPTAPRSPDELLEATRGLWKAGDGLAWQQKLRREW